MPFLEATRRNRTTRAHLLTNEQRRDAVPLSDLLARWVAEGTITSEQAVKMGAGADVRAYAGVAARPDRARRTSLVVEALAYLGGAITVAGSMLVAGRLWDELSTSSRLAVVGGAALCLLVGGAAVPARMEGVGERLRSVLWLASTAAFAGFLVIFADHVLDLTGDDLALLVASGTAILAVGLWSVHRTIVQQVAMMASLAGLAAAVIAQTEVGDLPGLGVWGVGLVWALLGWGGLLTPRRFALALGSATAIFGAMLTAESDAGTVLTLVTLCAAIVAALLMRDLLLLAVATVGALLNLPTAINRWFPDSVAPAFVLVIVGILIVAGAVLAARRAGPDVERKPSREYSTGSPAVAMMAAGAVLAGVTAVVLTIAWL